MNRFNKNEGLLFSDFLSCISKGSLLQTILLLILFICRRPQFIFIDGFLVLRHSVCFDLFVHHVVDKLYDVDELGNPYAHRTKICGVS